MRYVTVYDHEDGKTKVWSVPESLYGKLYDSVKDEPFGKVKYVEIKKDGQNNCEVKLRLSLFERIKRWINSFR